MKSSFIRPFYLIAFLLIMSMTARLDAAILYAPGHDWKVFETENFEIIYHEGEEFLARKAAFSAEDVYGPICEELQWKVRGKIRIVLSDQVDDTNGYSSQQPWNTVRIFMALPHSEDRLDYYDDWIRTILSHELTHAVHLDSVRAIPKGMRYVFGRAYFLHHIQPIFLVEGLAVYNESTLTSMGRNNSATSEMLLRTAMLEDDFPGIDKLCHWPRRWPAGGVPYIYGGMFHKYLAGRFGAEKFGDYSMKHAGQIWPFLFNHNAKLIFGRKITKLWKDFEGYSRERYENQKNEITQKPLTESRQISSNGGLHNRPRWIDDRRLVYEDAAMDSPGRLIKYDLNKNKKQVLIAEGRTMGSWPVKGKNQVLYSRIGTDDPWSQYHDLFIYDYHRYHEYRLTEGKRLRDPTVSPDGAFAVAVAQELSRTKLVKIDLRTKEIRDLTSYDRFEFMAKLGPPAFSPDGKSVALSVWHDDGNRDIFIYDLEKDTFRRITQNRSRDIDPIYSPDGKGLYFVSDQNGVYNIYYVDLEGGGLARITNVLTGAFEPAPSPDGRSLAFVKYSSKGYDVHVMDMKNALWEKLSQIKIDSNQIVEGAISTRVRLGAEQIKVEESSYKPWKSLLPSYWQPVFSTSAISNQQFSYLGFQTSGFDTLYRHSWGLYGIYDIKNNFPNVLVSYGYDRFAPSFRVSYLLNGLNYGSIAEDENGDTHNLFLTRNVGAFGFYRYFSDRFFMYLNGVAEHVHLEMEIDEADNDLPDGGWKIGPRFGAAYSDVEGYSMSIAPENGGVYIFTGAVNNHAFGSDYDVMSGIISLQQFISLPWYSNVVEFRTMFGAAQGDELYVGSFAVGGFTDTDLTAQTSGNYFPLRGYYRGELRGERALVLSADYHTPIWYQQRGIGTWPIFFDVLYASLFADTGRAWDDELDIYEPGKFKPAYGIELNQSLGLSYYYSFTLRFAYAYAPEKSHPYSYYLGTGGLF